MQDKKYNEKEIKLKVKNFEELIKNLNSLESKFLGKAFQRTIRFDNSEKGLENKGIFLRVRSGFEKVVTMKIKVKNDNVFERKEIELNISDVEKMREIIKNLGYDQEFIMEKYRADWKIGGVTASLDELPFGTYIELEGEEDEIFKVAKMLNLNTENKIVVTYWDLFEDYKKEKSIEGKDIVFEKNYSSKIKNKKIIM